MRELNERKNYINQKLIPNCTICIQKMTISTVNQGKNIKNSPETQHVRSIFVVIFKINPWISSFLLHFHQIHSNKYNSIMIHTNFVVHLHCLFDDWNVFEIYSIK